MLYFVYLLCILVINFLYSPYYYLLAFHILKDKIKYYILNINRFVFNFLWLADLVKNTKPQIVNLATKTSLIRELPQSCEMMGEAIKLGSIFCPARKKTRHDGCFYNPESGEITSTVQFKLKEEGSPLNLKDLLIWINKYHNLDRLDIGFQSSEDYERHIDLITNINIRLSLEGKKLFITAKDYSPYKLEHTCRSDIKDILDIQSSFNKIVLGVNNNMIDSCGEIIAKSEFFL